MSWNLPSLLWFRRNRPAVARGLVATAFWRGTSFSRNWLALAAHLLPVARLADAHFLAHDLRELPSRLSRRYRRQGKPVLTWTVRTQADRAKAKRYADAAIFETPTGELP